MSYDFQLDDDEKRELLRIARATLREFLRTGRIPPGKPHRDSLVADAGAFVSLRNGDELRGCIGNQHESKPLYKTVQEMAVAAASRDPRFGAIATDELDELTIEISVLGERRPLSEPTDLDIGVHGLFIDSHGRRGLLLPQVATEQAWTPEAFLEHVCTKAGLPTEAWRDEDSSVETFTAQVFSDTTHPAKPPA